LAAQQHGVPIAQASRWFGVTPQAYYQARRRALQKEAEAQMILTLVRDVRQRHPRMGARKLLHMLQPSLASLHMTIGRDAFFDLLRAHDLLVPPKRSPHRTTFSGFWRFPNLLEGLEVARVNQVWVADITYILTEEGYLYLALITDVFSRYIVGYDVSSSLAVEGALRALEMALRQANSPVEGLIHHSDHGVQYTASAYRERLAQAGLRSSMGAVGNAYDNALAERVNGILKIEYLLGGLFPSKAQAIATVAQAVYLYNFERPHLSLGYATPAHIFGLV